MNIRQLECFAKLCETLNFSKTADLLFITQPTVTHNIQTLEDELGLKLFLRTKRSVELLPAAISFYEDVVDILSRTNIAVSKARRYSIAYKSNIAVGYEANLLESICLPRVLSEFRSHCPDVYLYLKLGNSQERWNLFTDNKLDVVFTIKASIDSFNLVEYRELYVGRFVCVMPKDHFLSGKTRVNFNDLNGEHLVCLEPSKCPSQMARAQNALLSACTKSSVTYCDSQTIGHMLVKGGMGVVVMPDFIRENDPGLVAVPLDSDERISYGIACRRERKNTEIQKFIMLAELVYAEEL